MNTAMLKNEALVLWLSGMSEDAIAQELHLERSTIETWRDDERWHEFRNLCDLIPVLRNEAKADQEDARAVLLIDVAENIAGKIMSRGATSITADELHSLLAALKIARNLRRDVRLSRNARFLERKGRLKRW